MNTLKKIFTAVLAIAMLLALCACGDSETAGGVANYQVKVLDGQGNPLTTGVIVKFLKDGQQALPTNRKKVGAVLGDYVEVGCNSVLNPGTVIGRHSNVYPTSCVRGEIPADSIFKTGARIVKKS